MKQFTITPTFKFDENDIIGIISAAIYDIDYWGCIDNGDDEWEEMSDSLDEQHTFEDVFYQLLKSGKSVRILDAEDYDQVWNLTLQKLLDGVRMTIENHYWDGDMDSIDGMVGDIVFQYALFEEIIYG